MLSSPFDEIARQVGFANPFYFPLRFRRHAGRSPRALGRAAAAQP